MGGEGAGGCKRGTEMLGREKMRGKDEIYANRGDDSVM